MTDNSLWREKAREVIGAGDLPSPSADQVDESTAIVQRLFAVAVQCAGGAAALVQHLGLTYSELRTYLSGTAMPPEEVLLRALELVIEHRKATK
jgi:hypothetical protein